MNYTRRQTRILLGPEEHLRGRNGADQIKTESVAKARSPELCWLPKRAGLRTARWTSRSTSGSSMSRGRQIAKSVGSQSEHYPKARFDWRLCCDCL